MNIVPWVFHKKRDVYLIRLFPVSKVLNEATNKYLMQMLSLPPKGTGHTNAFTRVFSPVFTADSMKLLLRWGQRCVFIAKDASDS